MEVHQPLFSLCGETPVLLWLKELHFLQVQGDASSEYKAVSFYMNLKKLLHMLNIQRCPRDEQSLYFWEKKILLGYKHSLNPQLDCSLNFILLCLYQCDCTGMFYNANHLHFAMKILPTLRCPLYFSVFEKPFHIIEF